MESVKIRGFAPNRRGNFRVGLRTEKSRLRRALTRMQDQMRRMRHLPIRQQTDCLNQMLRGHYAYYGIAGNIRAADQGAVSVAATKAVSPLLGAASYRHAVKQLLTSVVREICTLSSVGAGARATAPGHPVGTGHTGVPTAIAN